MLMTFVIFEDRELLWVGWLAIGLDKTGVSDDEQQCINDIIIPY